MYFNKILRFFYEAESEGECEMSARGMYGASKQRRSLTVGRETYQIWTQMVLMAAVGIVYTPLGLTSIDRRRRNAIYGVSNAKKY